MSEKPSIKLNNGRLMPIIGLGTALADLEVFQKAIRYALDLGYRSIDTAFLYENEHVIGEVLESWLKTSGVKREDLFITTKLPAGGNRPEDVARFLGKSLKSLRLDYVDLYLMHHPFGFKNIGDDVVQPRDAEGKMLMDFDTDIEAVWKVMEAQVESGRTRAIGISNFNASQVERIMKVAKIAPSVHQIELHVYLQQRPLVQLCRQHGMALEAYSPLGAPFSKEANEISPPLFKNPVVTGMAKKYGKSSSQVVLRFLVQENLRVIPKSVTPSRIKENFEIFDFSLTEEEMNQLRGLDRGEEGRVYHFKEIFKGCDSHKEYPF